MITATDARTADSTTADSRAQAVQRILRRNPGVDPAFLDRFSVDQLDHYAQHLECLETPRGRDARWTRTTRTPAVTGWSARAERISSLWS